MFVKILRTLDLKKAVYKTKLGSLTVNKAKLLARGSVHFTGNLICRLICIGACQGSTSGAEYTRDEVHRLSPVTSSTLKKIHLLYSSFFKNTAVDIILPENYL